MTQASLDSTGYTGLVQRERVHRRVYTDEAIFALEQARIFQTEWLYVAHESQLRAPGDYLTTFLGAQPIIVSRGEDGAIHVLYNRCAHRGALVCQEPAGAASFFRCAYHGWTYRTSGECIGVSFREGYGRAEQQAGWFHLEAVASLATYRGFVFARAVSEGPDLETSLGGAKRYLDRFLDVAPGGQVELHPHPYRYSYAGNWKLVVENATDGYHPSFTHRSYLQVVARRTGDAKNFYARDDGPVRVADLGNGHHLMALNNARTKSVRDKEYGDSYYERARATPGGRALVAALEAELGREAVQRQLEAWPDFNLAVFPNLMIIQSQVRTVYPRAAGRSDIVAHATTFPGASRAINQLRLRMQEGFWGPAGFGVPDDLEVFERCQRGLAVEAREWVELSRGLAREDLVDGALQSRGSDETNMRGFYRYWDERMGPLDAP